MLEFIDHSTFTRSLFIALVCILPITPPIIYYLIPTANRTKKHIQITAVVSGITTGISAFGLGYYFCDDFLTTLVAALAAAVGMFFSMKSNFKAKRAMGTTTQLPNTENGYIQKKQMQIIGYSCGIFTLLLILLGLFTPVHPFTIFLFLGPAFLVIMFLIINKRDKRIK